MNQFFVYTLMRITWDAPKRQANIEKHGLDFASPTLEFFAGAVILLAKKARFQAVGIANDESVSVIFAALGAEGVPVISMRRVNAKERAFP